MHSLESLLLGDTSRGGNERTIRFRVTVFRIAPRTDVMLPALEYTPLRYSCFQPNNFRANFDVPCPPVKDTKRGRELIVEQGPFRPLYFAPFSMATNRVRASNRREVSEYYCQRVFVDQKPKIRFRKSGSVDLDAENREKSLTALDFASHRC